MGRLSSLRGFRPKFVAVAVFDGVEIESYLLIRWNVIDRAGNPVKDHVVWEPVDGLVSVFVVIGVTDPNRAQILILG